MVSETLQFHEKKCFKLFKNVIIVQFFNIQKFKKFLVKIFFVEFIFDLKKLIYKVDKVLIFATLLEKKRFD